MFFCLLGANEHPHLSPAGDIGLLEGDEYIVKDELLSVHLACIKPYLCALDVQQIAICQDDPIGISKKQGE